MQQCIEAADERCGLRPAAARRRGDRRRHRLVAELLGAVRRVRQDRRRRQSGQIITGAQECGTGAVMTLRQLAADELGMRRRGLPARLPGHRRSPRTTWVPPDRRRCSTTAAPSSPPPARSPSNCASWPPSTWKPPPADIVLADGMATVAGTPDATVLDRRARRHRRRRRAAHRPRLGHAARRHHHWWARRCVGDVGMAAFVAPQFSCHAVRVKLDRDTGVVRVVCRSAPHTTRARSSTTIGAHGQVEGGVLMGIGQALTEGTTYDDRGQPAQRSAARVQAADVRRCSADHHPLRADRHARRRPARRQGARRGAERRDRRGDLERASRKLARRAGAPAADDRRAGVGGDRSDVVNFTIATTRRRSARRAGRRRAPDRRRQRPRGRCPSGQGAAARPRGGHRPHRRAGHVHAARPTA